ncbi:MAG: hypothetical protein ABI629_01525 [bacterium]
MGLWRWALLLMLLSACTPRRNTLEPYRDDAAASAALEARAQTACAAQRPVTPPNPFRTDGCSAWPDDGWVECCVVHDMAYWCGGASELRAAADEALRACVNSVAGGGWASSMYWGVRLCGAGWMPVPWRWGYGWPWLGDP